MHIKFTRMESYLGSVSGYKEDKSIWIPAEVLRQAIVRQEGIYYHLTLPKSETLHSVEVVKENPIELLKKKEEEKEEEIKKLIKGLGRGSQ